jgi:hypothetical protein
MRSAIRDSPPSTLRAYPRVRRRERDLLVALREVFVAGREGHNSPPLRRCSHREGGERHARVALPVSAEFVEITADVAFGTRGRLRVETAQREARSSTRPISGGSRLAPRARASKLSEYPSTRADRIANPRTKRRLGSTPPAARPPPTIVFLKSCSTTWFPIRGASRSLVENRDADERLREDVARVIVSTR